MFDDSQAVAASEEVMTFALCHFPVGLARLSVELGLLSFDPTEFSDHGQTDGIIVHS